MAKPPKTYLDDTYTTEDPFYCDNGRCPRYHRRFTFTLETYTTAHGGDDFYPACPECGAIVEEAGSALCGSDHSDRMTERAQMGLSSF